jgi:uncharacterized protein (UPF0212 family)
MMMNSINVEFIELKFYVGVYKCPFCNKTYETDAITKQTISFYCECGKELIIKKE